VGVKFEKSVFADLAHRRRLRVCNISVDRSLVRVAGIFFRNRHCHLFSD